MTDKGYLLAELSEATGVEGRTIRHWVSNGVVPGPNRMGPRARYPEEALDRVRAVSAMRDVHRMSLSDVRREVLDGDPARMATYATEASSGAPPRSAAADYLASLGAEPSRAAPPPRHGFRALEDALPKGVPKAGRPTRAEEWLRVPITPDVELGVRGPLDPEARARIERCADLIRSILAGHAP